MKTSYYQSPKLDPARHLVVQTSIGDPRFGTQPEWEMETIVPPRAILGLEQSPYAAAYVAHLVPGQRPAYATTFPFAS
jgi:hypothetical protein